MIIYFTSSNIFLNFILHECFIVNVLIIPSVSSDMSQWKFINVSPVNCWIRKKGTILLIYSILKRWVWYHAYSLTRCGLNDQCLPYSIFEGNLKVLGKIVRFLCFKLLITKPFSNIIIEIVSNYCTWWIYIIII